MKFSDIGSQLPVWLIDRMHDLSKWRGINWKGDGSRSEKRKDDGRQPAASLPVTECFDSHHAKCYAPSHPSDACLHIPMLDLDVLAALVPSSTDGHGHLYFNHVVYWKDYKELLKALANCGIIEHGYAEVSIARGGTSLRAPWIRKGHEKEDVVNAVNDFLAQTVDEKATPRVTPHVVIP